MIKISAWMRRAIVIAGLLAATIATAQETALDRYVQKPDATYGWELAGTFEGAGYTGYVLDFTSQTWRSEKEVDRAVWTHWLTIVKPDAVELDKAMLYIGGGANGDAMPADAPERNLRLALETGTVVASLGMVPNQPLHFADSQDHGRYEDDLIAYSRVKYIMTGDEEWLARLPMVKSGVKAMTAVQEFMASDAGGNIDVNEFVVAGGSKRAWTTWLVGAVDDRVIGIIPLVIDALNTERITEHHYAAYGFFSPALGDYVRHGLYPHKLGTPEFRRILDIEDPYMYRHRERLKIPKMVINASGDQYFLPDNSQFYFLEMSDEKFLRYVPNAKHNLAGSDATDTILSFYDAVINERARPDYTWSLSEDGAIRVTTETRPASAQLWQAVNPEARDFRLDTIGAAWTSTPIQIEPDTENVFRVPPPEEGFVAYLVELTYDTGGPAPLKVTTDVVIAPDILPYEGVPMEAQLGPREN